MRLSRAEQLDAPARRSLGHASYGGALSGEVLSVLPSIKNGDFEDWYWHWYALATATAAAADTTADPTSRGRALLRASNYFRTAMFFLNPTGSRDAGTFAQSRSAFTDTLNNLRIPCSILDAPYENGQMRTY